MSCILVFNGANSELDAMNCIGLMFTYGITDGLKMVLKLTRYEFIMIK